MSVVRLHVADALPSQPPAMAGTASVAPPLLMTVRDMADELRVSTKTIDRLCDSGKIPEPTKLGGSRRWRRAEIEAWVAAGMPDRATWARRTANWRP